MRKVSDSLFLAVVGDIHGRFRKVERWLGELEVARERPVQRVLAVGDVEAFQAENDPGRKAAKRVLPVEFGEYAEGARGFPRPLDFIGGNNESFPQLDALRGGGELAPNIRYLGRSGVTEIAGLRVAFLSGIYAPRFYDTPVKPPTTAALTKQAGYFRATDLPVLEGLRQPDLMLLHEWPRGLVRRRKDGPALRAHRFPWIGNPVAQRLVQTAKPRWLFCGHSHVPLATTLDHPDGSATRVVCLDQAARPEGALFWMEWSAGEPTCAGWGTSGAVAWSPDEPWDELRTPTYDEPREATTL